MSSVVAETNMQVSTQTARSKPGQTGQRSGNDGFSGLVDENLAATHSADATTADRPRQSARDGSPDQSGRRTGVHARPRNQTEAARQPSDDPSTNDAARDERTAETPAPTPATETPIRTGVVAAEGATDPVEAAAQTDAEETPAPAVPASGAAIVATAVTAQFQLEAEAGESVIESSDAITVSNPPATIAATPAETAANALARVESDTADAPATAAAETDTQAQPATDAATSTNATEPAPIARTDAGATAAAAEADASVETTVKVETAAADAQVDAKADTELAAASKVPESATPDEAAHNARLTARPEITPAEKPDDMDAAPEEPPAQPESRADRRSEANVATEPRPGRPAETEARPAQRAAHESAQPQPTSSEQPQPQPTGFGVSHTTSHMPNIAVQAAQLTAVPAAAVPVPINGLAVEIAANVQIGRSRFEIRLDPPELGRIDVRLDVDRQGQVTSHLIVEKAATLDLLRRDAQQLERALQDAGLKTSDNGLQFSLRDQQQQSGRNEDNGSGRNTQRLIVAEEETIAAETVGRGYGRMSGQRSGVDIRV